MITPKDNDDFEIAPGATEVHGWTKHELLSLPIEERPNIKDAWISFLAWAKETRVLEDKPIVLCAYNGFGFDFRLLIHNLRYFDHEITEDLLLIDPWVDMVHQERINLTLDAAHKKL